MKLYKFHNVLLKSSVFLLFFSSILVCIPATAEELKKEEQLLLAQTILREASAEIPNLPDDNFPPYGPALVQNRKVQLLDKVAALQGKVSDQEGLRNTADRAVRIAQTHISNIYPLSVIGNGQVNTGFLEDGAKTAEAALEAVRLHIKRRNMDAWLPLISGIFVRSGKMGKALEAAQMIVDERDRAIALRNIGLQEAQNGHEAKAEEILAQSQQLIASLDYPQDKAWYTVYGATRQFEKNRKAKAAEELAQAKILVQGVTEQDQRAQLLREIARLEHIWGTQEQFEASVNEVVRAIEMIPDVGSRVAQYADFAQLMNQTGFKARATALLIKARQDVPLNKDPSSKMTGFLSLAEGEWKLGHLKVATELVNLAIDALDEVEDPGRIGSSLLWYLFNTQVLGLVTPQDLKRIQQKVERISRDENRRNYLDLVTLAIIQAQHGCFQQAMETTNQIQDAPSSRGFPIQSIGKELAQANGLEKALAWATKLPTPVEKIYAHIGIAEGTLRAKN